MTSQTSSLDASASSGSSPGHKLALTETVLDVGVNRAGVSARQPLAERVALFGIAWAAVSGFGIAARIVATLFLGRSSELLEPPFLVHLASGIIPLVVWLLCRHAERVRLPKRASDLFCRVVEGGGLIGGATTLAVMGAMLAERATAAALADAGIHNQQAMTAIAIAATTEKRFALIVVFASTMMFTVRSALVPSQTKHTIALGVAMGVPIVAFPSLLYRPSGRLMNLAISTTTSWVVGIAVCAVLSAVIWGLYEDVEKARRLGQYTLIEKIGEGGMGVVYRARHALLRRPTAVKLLPSTRVGVEAIQRFEREVQLTAELKHPNTITVYDYGHSPGGVFYYAMELLEGPSLQVLVDRTGPQSPGRVIHVLRMICGALIEAHGRGLIHRDIKPANIVISERTDMLDVATILDFGLAREVAREKDQGKDQDLAITMEGKILGTPLYLSPESILAGETVDARSDLYALGAVAYFMLTAETVFTGKTIVEVCSHHLHTPPSPPSKKSPTPIPPELEALILRCLEKKPEDRPQSAKDLDAALDAIALDALDDELSWTVADAEAWWTKHRATFSKSSKSSSSKAQ